MHILLIHQIFVTPEEGGGTRHYEIAKFLVAMGHKVTVIASNVDYLTGTKKVKKGENKEGLEIVYSYTFPTVHKSFFFRALSFISFAISSSYNALGIKDIDLVWGTSPPLFQSLTSLLISKVKRKPFIFEVRDLWIDFAEELGIVKNPFVIRFMRFLEKHLYRLSQKIIVNSPGFKPFVSKYVSEKKIDLVPNGVLIKEIEARENLGFRSKHALNNKFIAIYLGNIGVANDIETILAAAEQLKAHKEIVLVIMGGGIKKPSFKKYIYQNKLSNVLLLDAVPKSEVSKILADVDVCIATLKNISLFKTTYPNKVFDYMAARKPTVLAIDGVIREVIELSKGGIYVNPGNSSELADALVKYYQNPRLKKKHGYNAREYVSRHFDRKKITGEFEKILLPVRLNSGHSLQL